MNISGITFLNDFVQGHNDLFHDLSKGVVWDERMASRKTASFGVAYNYSQIDYPYQSFPEPLEVLISDIEKTLGFTPNNCLLNYYQNGSSRMGFHSDQTDILAPETGVVIISLGVTRTLCFRNIANRELRHNYLLPSGSLLYMTSQVQSVWQHALLKDDTTQGRISMTFREII